MCVSGTVNLMATKQYNIYHTYQSLYKRINPIMMKMSANIFQGITFRSALSERASRVSTKECMKQFMVKYTENSYTLQLVSYLNQSE